MSSSSSSTKHVFEQFTNKYSLSKTLRFELRPYGKTREQMNEHLKYDSSLETFLKDQSIEDAYQILKPVLDEVHEMFINKSLEFVNIDFSRYFEVYSKKEDLGKEEKSLREAIGKTYDNGEIYFKKEYPSLKWKKGSKEATGSSILESQDILEVVKQKYENDEKVQNALLEFKGFFTYLGGFNQNRENYYETSKEAATAVATRIVHENLPKFCDNMLAFKDQKQTYLDIYEFLKERGNVLQDRDGNALLPITEDIFSISHFNNCLSQNQIEDYNKVISNANFLINLYNQANKKEAGSGKETIKAWMDDVLVVNRILKYFLVKESKVKGDAIDPALSRGLDVLLRSDDATWFKWYDALRNYLTKKPQDDAKENKLKLNFENGSLLEGWSDGQEKNKGAVLLRKDDSYYLGILRKKNIFDTEKVDNIIYQNTDSVAGRLILANLKFQTLAGKGFLGEFGESYGEMGKSDPVRAIQCLQKIIIDRYSKYPLLKRLAEKSYIDKKEFDSDIKETLQESYVCEFRPINWGVAEDSVERGDLYLFEIKTGKKKLQTRYWNEIFREYTTVQLNGGAEIFYRKTAISEKKIKHGYEEKPFVIEGKRFTEEKFLLHCPIKINYKAKSYSKPAYAIPEINKFINEQISKNPQTCFLGIDRGEKHLAYYALVDQEGKILDQGTLNMPFLDKEGNSRTIKAEKRTIDKEGKEKIEIVECADYNELLVARSGDRDYARKNWQTIGTIKELKDGYISQVVRKIADLAIFNETGTPSFIVLENLNIGFKRGRQKIEKQVYQKLELALAKKLNFFVDKNAPVGETGSVGRALQLTPPINNFGDLDKRQQFGIMLYARADYTSQTDPVTGWRKSIYLKKGSEEYIKQQVLREFKEIGFDGKDYYFDYTEKNIGKEWRLYSGKNGVSLDRFRGERDGDKNQWVSTSQDIVKILDSIFEAFDPNRSLLSQIVDDGLNPKKINEYTGWESLRFAIDLIQQIRNTGEKEEDNDFILSPVRDESGNHFDSRKASKNQPNSGDANGAYNIARKGIIMNEHIKRGFSLLVRDEEWDAWLAGESVWEKWVEENNKILKGGNKQKQST